MLQLVLLIDLVSPSPAEVYGSPSQVLAPINNTSYSTTYGVYNQIIGATVKNLHDQKSRVREQIVHADHFCQFFINTCKINTKVRDVARDTYYFLINFLILALLLVGELSTLTLSFNSPTIIPITLFTLFRSNSGFSLTADFVRLI